MDFFEVSVWLTQERKMCLLGQINQNPCTDCTTSLLHKVCSNHPGVNSWVEKDSMQSSSTQILPGGIPIIAALPWLQNLLVAVSMTGHLQNTLLHRKLCIVTDRSVLCTCRRVQHETVLQFNIKNSLVHKKGLCKGYISYKGLFFSFTNSGNKEAPKFQPAF